MSDAFVPSLEEPKDSNRSPLVRFDGILKEYKPETQKTRAGKDLMIINFNFTDVEVIECSEPYPFPIATIPLSYSERGDTIWDIWRKSVVRLVPSRDINELVGKRQQWYYGPCTLRRPLTNEDGTPVMNAKGSQEWGPTASNAWQVVSLEGVTAGEAGASLTDTIVNMTVGKNDSQFYAELMNNADIKKMAGFATAVEQASNRVLLSNLEATGLIKKSESGVWEKV